jgi:hypothetical protein
MHRPLPRLTRCTTTVYMCISVRMLRAADAGLSTVTCMRVQPTLDANMERPHVNNTATTWVQSTVTSATVLQGLQIIQCYHFTAESYLQAQTNHCCRSYPFLPL